MKTIKVFLVCSGLGHVRRGYESFSQECFEILSAIPDLKMTLFKGGGKPSKNEVVLWNLPRNSSISAQFGKTFGKSAYYIEQLTFFLSLIPHLQRNKPDVVYVCDINLANLIRLWRNWTQQTYKILFRNGGPVQPIHHLRWDHVQQVAPTHLQAALEVGVPIEKQSLIPNATHILSEMNKLTVTEQITLRHQLKLPDSRLLILSVGAIDKKRKRMDYVIREVATLSHLHPFVLLLGQQEAETSDIIALGNQLLGTENFQVRTVDKTEVANYYKAADVFVLASLDEGFGFAYVEAMSYGLPCLAHDYETSRFVLGEMGYFANLRLTGSLASLIPLALVEADDSTQRDLRHRSVYERFSWDRLQPEYVSLLQLCANLSAPISSIPISSAPISSAPVSSAPISSLPTSF